MCVGAGVGVEGEIVVTAGVVVAVGADHGHVGLGHAGRVEEGDDHNGRVESDYVGRVCGDGGGEEVVNEEVDSEGTEDDIAEELECSSTGVGCGSSVDAGEGWRL